MMPSSARRSPTPRTEPALLPALRTVTIIFEDVTCQRRFGSDDGWIVVLEFSAVVDGKQLKGIDMMSIRR